MKLGIISDTHNEIARIQRALQLLREAGATRILHCGDIEDVEAIAPFAGWDAHFVYGNCDWDQMGLAEAIGRIGGTLHGRFGHLEIEGCQLAFVHGDDHRLLQDLIASNAYQFVFHGHTHIAGERLSGETRVINPGALHRVAVKTCLLLDLPSGEAQQVVVEG